MALGESMNGVRQQPPLASCDFGQLTALLWVSPSASVKWGIAKSTGDDGC